MGKQAALDGRLRLWPGQIMPFLLIESKDSPVFPEAMEPNCFASCQTLRKRVMVNLEHEQLQASETEMG